MKQTIKRFTPAFLWRLLQRLRRRWDLLTFKKYIASHRYAGVPLKMSIEDPIGKAWYDWASGDRMCPGEIALLQQHKLRPGARVFDVGAHQGMFAMVFAHLVSPGGFVLAIEAQPHSAAVAERNRRLNNVENMKVLHAAASASSGEVEFGDGTVLSQGSKDAYVKVRSVALDDLVAEYGMPDVLFIDVDGFETQVLKGASKILEHRPDCYVEVHVGVGLEAAGGSADQVLTFFPREQYDLLISASNEDRFVPLDLNSTILKRHFFLLALARN